MNISLNIQSRGKKNVLISVSGRLDGQTKGRFEAFTNEIIEGEPASTSFTFDLAGLDYVSSMGLRVILVARKKIEKKGGKMAFANLQPAVSYVIEIAKVLPDWSLFKSVEEADAYFDSMQQKAKREQI
jgi:anti-sigma B factor antagonist